MTWFRFSVYTVCWTVSKSVWNNTLYNKIYCFVPRGLKEMRVTTAQFSIPNTICFNYLQLGVSFICVAIRFSIHIILLTTVSMHEVPAHTTHISLFVHPAAICTIICCCNTTLKDNFYFQAVRLLNLSWLLNVKLLFIFMKSLIFHTFL